MRVLPVLAALALLVAGCSDSSEKAPLGYTKLGTVAGVPVYVEVSRDGFTVNTKFVDDELACEGSAPLNPARYTELCNTQTKDSYVYAVAFPKSQKAPSFCDGRTYAKVKNTVLKGKSDWPFDVAVAAGRKPIFLTICLADQLAPSATPSPTPAP